MNLTDKKMIQAYHRNRLNGTPAYAQGWISDQSQIIRFEQIVQFGDFSGTSILDLGCGFGDFKSYLDQRFINFHYLGVDMMKEFINEASESFSQSPKTTFLLADFSTGTLPIADIVVASGSLNYRIDNPNHPYSIIETMWNSARQGVAFNLLDSRSFTGGNFLCGYDPEDICDFCRTLTENVECITEYHEHDFTVFLRKTEASIFETQC